jgi:hypothetical protein
MDNERIETFLDFVLTKADELEDGVPPGGNWGDAIHSHTHKLRELVQAYKEGMKNEFPSFVNEYAYEYVKEFNRENDPEYEMYLRLKKKFEE